MGFWAIAAPIIASVASSALSSATQKKGEAGQMGYDYVTPQSVGEQSPTGKYMADYFQQAMQGFATGEPWRGYGDYEQLMKRKLQRGQTEAFYGTPGQRYGAYSTGMETGALAGLGGGRTQANLRPLQNQWISGSQAIDEFLAQQGTTAMQQREQTLLNTGMGLSQPYGSQAIPYSNPGTDTQQSPWASMLGGALGGVNWGSMFGGGTTAGTSGSAPTYTSYGAGASGSSTPTYLSPKWGGTGYIRQY